MRKSLEIVKTSFAVGEFPAPIVCPMKTCYAALPVSANCWFYNKSICITSWRPVAEWSYVESTIYEQTICQEINRVQTTRSIVWFVSEASPRKNLVGWHTIINETWNCWQCIADMTFRKFCRVAPVSCVTTVSFSRPIGRSLMRMTCTPFTRWSWLDELALRALVEPARRALDERTTSARRAASWMFAILYRSNDHIASSSSQLVERSSSQLVEPASSCKRGIRLNSAYTYIRADADLTNDSQIDDEHRHRNDSKRR